MEKKKTAMQQLIDIIDENIKTAEVLLEREEELGNSGTHYYDKISSSKSMIGWLKNKAAELLQTEREQLEEAYNSGYRDGEADGAVTSLSKKDVSEYSNASDWFSETYETE